MTRTTTLHELYGSVLPPGLIEAAVQSAGRHGATEDPREVERAVRVDLDALADAVRRSPVRHQR